MRYDMNTSRRTRSGWFDRAAVCVAVVLLVGALFLYVGLQEVVMRMENDIRRIQAERETVFAEIRKLEIEAAELRKGLRIRRIASEQLGLVLPEEAPAKLF